jgi:hypothetical protein
MTGGAHAKKWKCAQNSKVDISTTTTNTSKWLLNFVVNDVRNTEKQQRQQKGLSSMS